MNKEEFKELTEINRIEKQINRYAEKIIGSVGLGVGISYLLALALVGTTNAITYLIVSTGIAAVACPLIYAVSSKISTKRKTNEEKIYRSLQNAFTALQESQEKNKTIGLTTTNFYKKVTEIEQRNDILLTTETRCYINDLLHLINANYYSQIVTYLPRLQREQLIDKMATQVELYIIEYNKKELQNKDIDKIISRCFFLKDSIKEAIIKEYNNSTIKVGKWIEHSIENKNIDDLGEDKYKQVKKREQLQTARFDTEELADYEKIIQEIIGVDDYLKDFGNTSNLNWDLESLKEIICIITKDHRQELLEVRHQYNDFDLTTSYIYNAMCYGIMNQRNQIGPKELLATFKEWSYLPFKLRATIASDIIEKQALDTGFHPFYKSKPKEKTKVIPISSIKKD